jgi:hypothetical protein
MRDRRLFEQVSQVLHQVWDPIGVKGIPEVENDEYQSYVAGVIAQINAGCDCDQLASYLVSIETEQMGLRGDRANAVVTVKTLLDRSASSGFR